MASEQNIRRNYVAGIESVAPPIRNARFYDALSLVNKTLPKWANSTIGNELALTVGGRASRDCDFFSTAPCS